MLNSNWEIILWAVSYNSHNTVQNSHDTACPKMNIKWSLSVYHRNSKFCLIFLGHPICVGNHDHQISSKSLLTHNNIMSRFRRHFLLFIFMVVSYVPSLLVLFLTDVVIVGRSVFLTWESLQRAVMYTQLCIYLCIYGDMNIFCWLYGWYNSPSLYLKYQEN